MNHVSKKSRHLRNDDVGSELVQLSVVFEGEQDGAGSDPCPLVETTVIFLWIWIQQYPEYVCDCRSSNNKLEDKYNT